MMSAYVILGRYLARAGANETLEGDWHAERQVLRHQHAKSNIVLIEGVSRIKRRANVANLCLTHMV
jgi:hypothetical protein